MRLVRVRIKHGFRHPIKDSQKLYLYYCPIKDIEVGNYVVVNVKSFVDEFRVARVEEILKVNQKELLELQPTGIAVCKVDVDDFDARCKQAKKIYYRNMALYDGRFVPKTKKGKKNDIDKVTE